MAKGGYVAVSEKDGYWYIMSKYFIFWKSKNI
jgi:hypothetical protein